MKDSLDELKLRWPIGRIAEHLFPGWRWGLSCRCPWREDKRASFSVYSGGSRFKDHGAGDQGDVFDFVAFSLRITNAEAIEFVRNLDGGGRSEPAPAPRWTAPTESTDTEQKSRKRASWPTLRTSLPGELEQLAGLRGLDEGGLFYAAVDGVLRFCETARNGACWAVRSLDGTNCRIRRLDGALLRSGEREAKSIALPGSVASEPFGVFAHERFKHLPVLVCEGEADVLACYSMLHKAVALDRWTVCGMGGASLRLPQSSLQALKGRRVRILAHGDTPGREAAARWADQVLGSGGLPEVANLPDGTDLNDLARLETWGETSTRLTDL